MKVVIAEKPSVARELAKVFGATIKKRWIHRRQKLFVHMGIRASLATCTASGLWFLWMARSAFAYASAEI